MCIKHVVAIHLMITYHMNKNLIGLVKTGYRFSYTEKN